ncbi:BLOC-1-related complex subunit 7-like [Ostrea edulis]|uniref:BLOC-1-related complex subunit 7-like n=1 Tax=Ostrea edulis TaxID=37623 RepID=UPI002094FE67|nr:BLOC-1-related complex subunit 7-like [Ostrea edulis]
MSWNQETKNRLNEKVAQNVHDVGSLVRHVVKTSKSSELLAQAAKNFSCQENVIHNSSESLKKMVLIKTQLEYQESAIERSMSTLSDIQEQLNSINR